MADRDHLEYLLKQFAAGQASGEEVDELFYLIRQGELDGELKTMLQQMVQRIEGELPYRAERWEPFIQQVLQSDRQMHAAGKSRKLHVWRWAAAAAVILLIGSGLYFLLPKQNAEQAIAVKPALLHDLAPGSTAAILTIAGGKQILLDSAGKGMISKQGSTEVMNTGGQLTYQNQQDSSAGRNTSEIFYNTLTTNKGNQYQLILPDGSKVWLNAASSITYPVAFTGNERKVEITGEAYFEVVHNTAKPFKVKVGEQLIEDIGTAFNVNAYPDEDAIRTTLLEGSVKVTVKEKTLNDSHPLSTILRPGEQTIFNIQHSTFNIQHDANL